MPPVVSAADLVSVLRVSQLLAPTQLDEISQNLQPRFPEARSLARALMERAWLTPFQVNALLQGGAEKLVLGPYVLLERLGENTLGQVFKARHHLMNRLVTLTIVREELLSQPKAVEQFYHEIQVVSQLSDAHIVHAYDAGMIGPKHFFAQEYVDGTDLEHLVQQTGPLSIGTATNYICQAALGLQHASAHGLLHHDLRPANLLVAKIPGQGLSVSITTKTPTPSKAQLRDASIKINNLGLTLLQPRLRRTDPAAEPGAVLLDYVAPEQAQGNQPLDIRSNLYSLGCIYYYLLAGRPPFAGTSSSVKLQQHQVEAPKPLNGFRRDVPPLVSSAIDILMAKRPEERYQTPAELLAALFPNAPLVPGVELGTQTPTPGEAGESAGRLARMLALRPRRRYILGTVALVLLLPLLAWIVWPAGHRTATTSGSAPPEILARYTKKATRDETIFATLKDNGYPTLEGTWYWIGPFDNSGKRGFDTVYPPEKEIDLKKSYPGKNNEPVSWKPAPNFKPGHMYNLRALSGKYPEDGVIYLYHEMEMTSAGSMRVSFGSDDTLTVWLNGKKLISDPSYRGAAPDQDIAMLDLTPGKNHLLAKVCQGNGDWAFYAMPRWPEKLDQLFGSILDRDFPRR